MSEKTGISYCDSTINAWTVCSEVSPGCGHCFARELAKRYGWGNGWGKGVPRHKFTGAMKNLAALNRRPWICANGHAHAIKPNDKCGHHYFPDAFYKARNEKVMCRNQEFHSRIIFNGDLCDIFDEEAPIELLAEWLDGMRLADRCTNLLCTKRPENFMDRLITITNQQSDCSGDALPVRQTDLARWLDEWLTGNPPANIILLTSVENQAMADKRIPELLKIPAACRGLSLEPLMGPVDLMKVKTGSTKFQDGWALGIGIDWLIIGCESGPRRRPCNLEWIESLVEQGLEAGVPVWVKQISMDGKVETDMSKFPKHLQIREWPKG